MFTDDQKKAIFTRNKNILVSAGAGSGKTAVLKQRVLEYLKEGVNIDELLILTFTNDAAIEMRTRILDGINQEELNEQLEHLEYANITTFDAYNLKLVKEYQYLLNIDKNVAIADPILLDMMVKKTLDNILLKYYVNLTSGFESLINNYTIFDDGILKEKIIKLYHEKQNIFNLKDVNIVYSEEIVNEKFAIFEIYLTEIIKKITMLLNRLKSVCSEENEKEYFMKLYLCYEQLLNSKYYDEIYQNLTNLDKRPNISKNFINEPDITQINNEIKDQISDLKEICNIPTKHEYIKNLLDTSEIAQILEEIIKKLEQEVWEFKIKNNMFDFADITKLAISLLENNRDIKMNVQERFIEVMIDEYQDTNDFQNYFISLITKNNAYMVGDVKQAIYGFRNANPKNFIELENKYTKDDSLGDVIKLTKNFRSRIEVLKGINQIFSDLMTTNYGGVNYNDNHSLQFGNNNYIDDLNLNDYNFSILNYDKELIAENDIEIMDKYLEPFIIGLDILKKIKDKYQIRDLKTKSYRDCRYEDFVILTRKKSNYSYYMEVFEFLKITLNSQQEPSFKDKPDIKVLNIIFNVINVHENSSEYKFYFIALLRSFVFNISDEDIEKFQLKGIESKEILEVSRLIKEQRKSINLSLEEQFDQILSRYEKIKKVIVIQEISNVDKRLLYLRNICITLDLGGYVNKTLLEFFTYLNESKKDVNLKIDTKDLNAVSLMTIYKSKGLEFPIVYIAELNSKLFRTDTKTDFMYTQDETILVPYVHEYKKYHQFNEYLIKRKKKKNDISEQVRLFYVALTRAKEQFIFVSGSDFSKLDTEYKSFNSFLKVQGDRLKLNINFKNNLPKEIIMEFNNTNKTKTITQENKFKIEDIKYTYNDQVIIKNKVIIKQASKKVLNVLDTKKLENITLGNELHKILEWVDFKDLPKEYESKLVEEILNKMIMHQEFSEYINCYQEYEFYNDNIHGIIDCILEFKDYYLIIDYKLNDLNDDNYSKQLAIYKEFLISKVNKPVKTALYSLMLDEIKYIEE